jgi:anthranilate synthase/aminodeoxychorismate synthase-like glutamine amidotransferase
MILLIDNYDSFTYNLYDYFVRLGEQVLVVKNDELDEVSVLDMNFDRLVISPGPNTPDTSGNLMKIVHVLHDKLPILGICLGHQALGQYFGAELHHADRPMHGKVSRIVHNGKGIYEGLPESIQVCRYHSLILKHLDRTELEETSRTADGSCMGFTHRHLPVTGMQFHPEAILTEFGLDMLKNWLKQTLPGVSSPA